MAMTRKTLKAIPAVRAVTRSWRGLTGGGAPTLVACSGGADSVALALALWSAGASISLGHVVHDLRREPEAHADRDLVEALAGRLGCPFTVSSISVAGVGNDEGVARLGRYGALASMAQDAGMRFVASAHHANDQLESMLMAIARGSGLEGLAGVADSRRIGGGALLIRPMLKVSRADTEEICAKAGVEWAHDLTNDDTNRLRSAVRAGPARSLTEIRPEAPAGAVRAGDLLRDAAMLVQDRALEVFGHACQWERAALRHERGVVLGAGLRANAMRLTDGVGADALSRRVLDPVVRAIRDDSTEPRHFHWPSGIEVTVTANRIEMLRSGTPRDKGAIAL
jgi:tRNA(Ile)-lysidine synthase